MAKKSPSTITHPTPTKAVVREVVGTALQCGSPDCRKPLYLQDNNTGKMTRNSEVAHIHAQASGGPRWLEGMTSEQNQSAENLLMLCEQHHTQVDDNPTYYTAAMLKDWKKVQVRFATKPEDVPRIVPTETQIEELLSASIERLLAAHSDFALPLVRALERFIATVEQERRLLRVIAGEWKIEVGRHQRFAPRDIESGERIHVEPPRVMKLEYQNRVIAALSTTGETLRPLLIDVRAELAAATSGGADQGSHGSWVNRAVDRVSAAASRWSREIYPADDAELFEAITEVRDARDALLQHLRGEDAPEPPAVAPDEDRESSEFDLLLETHRQLLSEAEPYRHASKRPFDRDLHERIVEQTAFAVWVPPIVDFLPIDLWHTSETAATIARKASDDEVDAIIGSYKARHTSAAAAFLLFHLITVMEEEGRSKFSAQARASLLDVVEEFSWRQEEAWGESEMIGARLMQVFAHVTSAEAVRKHLEAALKAVPDLSALMIPAVAGWRMLLDSEWQRKGAERHFRDIAPWLPVDGLIAAGKQLSEELRSEEVERLILELQGSSQ